MDTSKEFILQCEKAVEIQEGWRKLFNETSTARQTNRDVVCLKGTYDVTFIHNFRNPNPLPCLVLYGEINTVYPELLIWLPTQAQLQRMIDKPLYKLLDAFWEWHHYQNLGEYFTSMEQLWLAFVMAELYQKRWNEKRKDWVL